MYVVTLYGKINYVIRQEHVITLSGNNKFITFSGWYITLSGSYYNIMCLIALSGSYYISWIISYPI